MKQSIFTISLDFELHWGVFDKENRRQRMHRYENTLQLIPEMLALFAQYQVRATWATVGSVFAQNILEWAAVKPVLEPEYAEPKYSAYHWVKNNGIDDLLKEAHFAPQTIAAIVGTPGQELGTHTFSHYYCMEPQKNPDAFSADLTAAKTMAEKIGIKMVSLVFPRNQFNPFFLKACFDAGIRVVRTNTNNWFWTPIPDKGSNLLRKVFRTGDGYIPLGRRTSFPIHVVGCKPGEPLQLPASRLFRSWHAANPLANRLRMGRIINEMSVAAKRRECYHLWWHPENFGVYPKENLNDLARVLQHFDRLRRKDGMVSWNMGDFAANLLD